jgi:chromosome partitioning protein
MNMKGGVGKTTLAVNIGYALAEVHEKTVLVVDADPQFNATQYLLQDDAYLRHIRDRRKGTLRDIFVPRRPGHVRTVPGSARTIDRTGMSLSDCTCLIFNRRPGKGRLDLVPSMLELMDIEMSPRGTETKLKNYLQEKAGHFDYVIIDCPPTISIFTQAAVLASDRYLVPIKPDPLSVIGLPLLERWLADYTRDAGLTIDSIGLVFTLVRGPTPRRMRDVIADLKRQRKTQVFEDYLSESTVVAESVEAHQPVFRYKPRAKTSRQIIRITEEFLERTS